MTGQSTPAGWYPDPENASQERYWDGAAWGESRALASAGFGAPAGAPAGVPAGYGFGAGGGGAPATFGQRVGAYLIDYVIVFVPLFIVVAILGSISNALALLGYLAGLVGMVYYFAHFEGGPTGQTIGKKQMKIRVVNGSTMQPGIGMGPAVARFFARILAGAVCYLGLLWMLWDEKKETWQDKMTSTKVVQV